MKLKVKTICEICKQKFESSLYLAIHVNKAHNLSSENYYRKYLLNKLPNVNNSRCAYCGFLTKFTGLATGYNRFCSTKCASYWQAKQQELKRENEYLQRTKNYKIVCRLCGLRIETYKGLASHIARQHYPKFTSKIYYDTFLKKKNEGICKICGKQTDFISIIEGYRIYCSDRCSNNDIEVKQKIRATKTAKYGGVFLDSPTIKKKIEKTNLKNLGYKNPFLNPKIQEQIRNDREKRTGYRVAAQSPSIHKKIFSHKRKNNHGYLSNSEYQFSKMLKKIGISFKYEYFIKGDDYYHHFDFAIFKNNKLKCLVEIDGEYYHGLIADCDGIYSRGDKDYLRYIIVPKDIKFLVIDSKKLKEGFKELLRILPTKYKDWKKEMIHSIPKNIEESIPKFSKNRMLLDWNKLCKYQYNYRANLGKSILLNFCRSRIIKLLGNDWNSIRKTLYKSPCSEHHVLEGLDDFKNTSNLREKYRVKYKGYDTVVVKHHSPEKMLAICSLGKTYISKEPIDRESVKIIKFLKLKAFELKKRIK